MHYELGDNVQQESITCQQIYQTARKYSTFFKQNKIAKDELVIVIAKQTPETIYTIYGLMMIGAIPVLMPSPVNDSKMHRLKTAIRDLGAKWLTGIEVNKQLPEECNITILYPRNSVNNLPMISESEMTISNIVCLLYTSGSIHLPKGVMISHKNILTSLKLIESSYHSTPEDIYISWTPYYHIMGLCYTVFWNTYSNRRDIIIQTENYLENPKRWFKAIQDYHGTMTMAPNSAYLTSARESMEMNINLSSLKYAGNGSEPVLC